MAAATEARRLTAAAVVAIGNVVQTAPLGLLVFGPLGADFNAMGITAALIGAVVGGVVVLLAGGQPIQVAGPRANSALVLSSLVVWLIAASSSGEGHSLSGPAILLLTGFAVLLSGALQMAVGRARFARIIKFIPFPVASGFQLGIAVSIALAYAPLALGVAPGAGELARMLTPSLWSGTSIVAAGTTVAVALVWDSWRNRPPLPGMLLGLTAGLVVFLLVGGRLPIPALRSWPPALPVSAPDAVMAARFMAGPAHLGLFVVFTMAVAIVATFESLIGMALVDGMLGTYTDTDRELSAQGWSNLAIGACLGIVSSNSPSRTRVALAFGSRDRLIGFLQAPLVAAFLLVRDPNAVLPPPLVAGILLLVAWGLCDRWSLHALRILVARDASDRVGPRARRDGILVVVTAATAVLFHPIAAVAVGIILAAGIFIVDMSRPVIRADVTGPALRSRRLRPPSAASRLAAAADRLRIIALEGPLFFGTADGVRRRAEALALSDQPAGILLLRLGRVSDLDATGLHVLRQSVTRLQGRGWSVAMSEAMPNLATALGRLPGLTQFADLDAALEWAEARLLDGDEGGEAASLTLDQAAAQLTDGMSEDQRAALLGAMTHRTIRTDEILFHAGDPGDTLYLVAAGIVRIEVAGPRGPLRIVSFSPGVVFGEMALLDGRPRSATARAEADGAIYELTASALDDASARVPGLRAALMRNLALVLAGRLRDTTNYFRDAAL